ncbi:MAG TPA: glycosyltransferase [Frankiaceae bacterium]|nr:glycosyltransferase [Frankiaceae bacterium]
MTLRAARWGAYGMTAYGLLRMARVARNTAPRVATPWTADVVAIVPARDEARGIADCVNALRANGLRDVVVVDDASSDDTADLARQAGATVVGAPPLRAGQRGKAAACLTGAGTTRSEWLWFVDADVTVAPDALSRLLAVADESGASLVSALGRVATPTPAMAWLLPEVGLTLARRVDLETFASGQCLLVHRAAYDAVGGHDVTAVAEDLALARAVTHRGYVVRTVLGPDLYETRMYATLGEAWRGLVKNAADVRRTPKVEYAWLAATLLGGRRAYAMNVVVSAGGRLVARQPLWPAAAAPIAELWLIANWWRSRRRPPVAWKGRPVW